MFLIILLLGLFLSADFSDAALRKYGPQGPAGHSSCTSFNRNRDVDGDGLVGRVDPGCTSGAYDQFSSVTGGYAAYFEDAFLDTINLEVFADANSPSGNSVRVKPSSTQGYGDARMCGNFTSNDYYVKFFGLMATAPSLIYIDDAVLAERPTASLRTSVPGIGESSDWSTALDNGWSYATGTHSNTDFKFTLNGNQCIDVRIFAGTTATTLFLSTNKTEVAAHPSQAATPAYTIFLKGAGNTITIDGVGNEGPWAHADGAPVVSVNGRADSNDTGYKMQLLRDGATIYFLATANDADISCNSTGDDQNATWDTCDHWELLFTNSQSTTRDSNTVKASIDTNGNLYDANYPSESESSVFDFTNVSITCVTGSGKKTCEGKFDLPYTPTGDSIVLANFLHDDYDSAAHTYFEFGVAGSFNDLANARYVKMSSTALGTLTTPDVTAPGFNSFSSGTPSSTGTQASVTIDEAGTCTIKYGTSSDTYANYPNTLGTFNANFVSTGNYKADFSFAGLASSTTHYWRANCSDSVPNSATSAEQNFATAATATASCGFFELPSVWCKTTGDTLSARQATFANKSSRSDTVMAFTRPDWVGGITPTQSTNPPGGNSNFPKICVATSGDPLKNVIVNNPTTGNWQADGWFTNIRVPASCLTSGTPGSDQHVILYRSDDSSFIWEFWLWWYDGTNYRAERGRRWARTAAASTGGDGLGRGVLYPRPSYDGNSLTTACGASATKTMGTITKEELQAGEIKHKINIIVPRTHPSPYTALWPCNYNGAPGGQGTTSSFKHGEHLMLNPDINVDGLSYGNGMKIVLKALQNYGGIITDQTCSSCGPSIGQTEDVDMGALGFSFSASGIGTFLADNLRIIKCVEAFAGECPAGE